MEAVVEIGKKMGFRDTLLGPVGLASSATFLRGVSYVEKAGNDRCVATLVWSFSPAWEAVELTPLVWRVPRWRGGCHFHQAVYLPRLSSQ